MSEFKTIETQEQFDAAIADRISRLKAQHSEASAELQKKLEALTMENASLQQAIKDSTDKYANYDTTLADLQAKVKNYETASVKSRIAHEVGIPYELISTLQGSTEEEIKAHAETLSKFISKPAAPLATPERVQTDADETRQALRSMLTGAN